MLKAQIEEYSSKINQKERVFRDRRHTIAQVESFSEEMKDKFTLPQIVTRQGPDAKMVLLGRSDSKMAKAPPKNETQKGDKVAKKGRYKEKWREYFDGPINLDLNRPQTNQLGAVKKADPKKLFSSIPDLKNNRAVIDEIVDAQEEMNMCTNLTKTLDIHTSQKINNVPGLN